MRITELDHHEYDAASGLVRSERDAASRDPTRSALALAKNAPPLVTHEAGLRPAAEKFQLLRVWFENWTTVHQQRVILVSSSLPGEGKSFIALNLAATLATAGHRVLLIDADLRRPCLHRSVDLVPSFNLTDFLAGRAELPACLNQVAALPKLALVAGGGAGTSLAAELIAGPRMSELITQACQLEPPHFVLLDAPAALAAPETAILAGLCDAALLVVAANRTPRRMVAEAVQLLQRTATCGVVFNRFEPAFSTSRKIAYGRYAPGPSWR